MVSLLLRLKCIVCPCQTDPNHGRARRIRTSHEQWHVIIQVIVHTSFHRTSDQEQHASIDIEFNIRNQKQTQTEKSIGGEDATSMVLLRIAALQCNTILLVLFYESWILQLDLCSDILYWCTLWVREFREPAVIPEDESIRPRDSLHQVVPEL
jgi:hypothetical protein